MEIIPVVIAGRRNTKVIREFTSQYECIWKPISNVRKIKNTADCSDRVFVVVQYLTLVKENPLLCFKEKRMEFH